MINVFLQVQNMTVISYSVKQKSVKNLNIKTNYIEFSYLWINQSFMIKYSIISVSAVSHGISSNSSSIFRYRTRSVPLFRSVIQIMSICSLNRPVFNSSNRNSWEVWLSPEKEDSGHGVINSFRSITLHCRTERMFWHGSLPAISISSIPRTLMTIIRGRRGTFRSSSQSMIWSMNACRKVFGVMTFNKC